MMDEEGICQLEEDGEIATAVHKGKKQSMMERENPEEKVQRTSFSSTRHTTKSEKGKTISAEQLSLRRPAIKSEKGGKRK
jgi:hypothetical protein